MENKPDLAFSEILRSLVADAASYFDQSEKYLAELGYLASHWSGLATERDYYWDGLPQPLQTEAHRLVAEILSFAGQIAPFIKSSPLNTDSDQRDLVINTKVMRSALLLRDYKYWDTHILHDEGTVLGVQPAGQSDDRASKPPDAKESFMQGAVRIDEIIQLVEAGGTLAASSSENSATSASASRYRRGTAFIMMSMDKSNPELEDVRNTIVEVFKTFGIRAVRADDIEHEGLITEQVLHEIATSEFLFADLTGERPNVYYEVGYAHALGKRVILFRKTATGIHFDLAGYNCPDYKNLADLKEKLTKRLAYVTNKNLHSLDSSET